MQGRKLGRTALSVPCNAYAGLHRTPRNRNIAKTPYIQSHQTPQHQKNRNFTTQPATPPPKKIAINRKNKSGTLETIKHAAIAIKNQFCNCCSAQSTIYGATSSIWSIATSNSRGPPYHGSTRSMLSSRPAAGFGRFGSKLRYMCTSLRLA